MLTVARKLRLQRGLTVRELAKIISVHESAVSRFECKQGTLPRHIRPELAKFYGVDESKIFDKHGLAK